MPTPAPDSTPTAAEGDGPLEGALLGALLIASFGSFLLNLSSTTVNVAIDKLMTELHAPLSTIQWIVTGYLLALTLVLPSFRWAVERLGSRRLYVACLLGFSATSVLSALAWSASSLIAFRVLQGAVGGLLAPLTQTLIAQLAGPKRMGRAVGIMSMPVLLAPLLGPMLGGLLVQRFSWRWLFLFNVPFGLVGAWLAQRRLPAGHAATRTRLDLWGLMLLSPGVALFTFGLSALGHAHGASGWRTGLPLCISESIPSWTAPIVKRFLLPSSVASRPSNRSKVASDSGIDTPWGCWKKLMIGGGTVRSSQAPGIQSRRCSNFPSPVNKK